MCVRGLRSQRRTWNITRDYYWPNILLPVCEIYAFGQLDPNILWSRKCCHYKRSLTNSYCSAKTNWWRMKPDPQPDQEWTLPYASNNVVASQMCLLALKVKVANYIKRKKNYTKFIYELQSKENWMEIYHFIKSKVYIFIEVYPCWHRSYKGIF